MMRPISRAYCYAFSFRLSPGSHVYFIFLSVVIVMSCISTAGMALTSYYVLHDGASTKFLESTTKFRKMLHYSTWGSLVCFLGSNALPACAHLPLAAAVPCTIVLVCGCLTLLKGVLFLQASAAEAKKTNEATATKTDESSLNIAKELNSIKRLLGGTPSVRRSHNTSGVSAVSNK